MNNERQATTASWVNVLAGLWLIIAPFVLNYPNTTAQTNDIWLGIIVVAIALIRAFRPISTGRLSIGNLVAGLWLIAAPFILGYRQGSAPMWNDIILGVIIFASSLWSGGAAMTNQGRTSSRGA